MSRSVQAIVASALIVLLRAGDGVAEPMQLVVDGRMPTVVPERPVADIGGQICWHGHHATT